MLRHAEKYTFFYIELSVMALDRFQVFEKCKIFHFTGVHPLAILTYFGDHDAPAVGHRLPQAVTVTVVVWRRPMRDMHTFFFN
jgi:hypothetical protein